MAGHDHAFWNQRLEVWRGRGSYDPVTLLWETVLDRTTRGGTSLSRDLVQQTIERSRQRPHRRHDAPLSFALDVVDGDRRHRVHAKEFAGLVRDVDVVPGPDGSVGLCAGAALPFAHAPGSRRVAVRVVRAGGEVLLPYDRLELVEAPG